MKGSAIINHQSARFYKPHQNHTQLHVCVHYESQT
jgi:hypothetical protein